MHSSGGRVKCSQCGDIPEVACIQVCVGNGGGDSQCGDIQKVRIVFSTAPRL